MPPVGDALGAESAGGSAVGAGHISLAEIMIVRELLSRDSLDDATKSTLLQQVFDQKIEGVLRAERQRATWELESEREALASQHKSNVCIVDITSTRMLGAYGFLATVFDSFKTHKLSVDAVATSEVSVSLTLNRPGPVLNKPDPESQPRKPDCPVALQSLLAAGDSGGEGKTLPAGRGTGPGTAGTVFVHLHFLIH